MNVSWVFDKDVVSASDADIAKIKNIGSTWGSWESWRSWHTDNVVCCNLSKSIELVNRGYQNHCNFYIPEDHFVKVSRQPNIKLFGGSFDTEFNYHDQVMCMMLTAAMSEIVLLVGFNLDSTVPDDKYDQVLKTNYQNAVKRVLLTYPKVQWVLIDNVGDLDPKYKDLTNLTCDTMENVLQLLS